MTPKKWKVRRVYVHNRGYMWEVSSGPEWTATVLTYFDWRTAFDIADHWSRKMNKGGQ